MPWNLAFAVVLIREMLAVIESSSFLRALSGLVGSADEERLDFGGFPLS